MSAAELSPGQSFTRTFAVTEAVYRGFLAAFNDRNPLHVDRAFAQSKGFASEVMHGNILGGFLSYFVGECLPFKDVIIHSQEISFRKPVYLGDVLELRASVEEVHASVGAARIRFEFVDAAGAAAARGRLQIGRL
jgi:3-hydroxybutyryl-CoA dehydratase